jgi:hypothetical protein
MSQGTASSLVANQWSRVSGTFVNPIATFKDVVKQPSWVAPLLISTILSIGYTFEMGHHVGWARLIQYRISHSTYASLPAGEQEAIIQQQLPLTELMGYLYGSLGTAVELLAVAIVLYALFANGRLKFKQAFSIVSYASLPGAIAALIGALVVALKNPDDVDPNRVLLSDASAFFGAGNLPARLFTLLSSFDVFSIWILLLTAIGFWVASGSKSFPVSFAKVSVPWAVWIAIRVALT